MQSKFDWMPYEEVEEFLERIYDLDVSPSARGDYSLSEIQRRKKLSSKNDSFLSVYSRVNDPDEMYRLKSDVSGLSWGDKRDRVVRMLRGKYEKTPSERLELSLIAWAYDPNQ